MGENQQHRRYREDAAVLAQIGASLSQADLPEIEVRLPEHLARAAVEAWERDETGEVGAETFEERAVRHQAATLALIGLAVSDHAVADGGEVVVSLHPGLL